MSVSASDVCKLQVRQAERESGGWWYLALRATERQCVYAHSWKLQLLLANCPPMSVSSPSPMCLCLGFLSFFLPLQIVSNATEECSTVVEIVKQSHPMSRIVFFSFNWYFMKNIAYDNTFTQSFFPNPSYNYQTLTRGFTIFAIIWHTHCTYVNNWDGLFL